MSTFGARELLSCYARGVFPMADAREDEQVFLIDPAQRGIIPLGGFHVPKRLARTVRHDPFQIRVDTAFEQVVGLCAAAAPDRPDTWINRPIQTLYADLYALGLAHSVEAWRDGALAGGLYGVALGGAFFGESMFSVRRDASKVALVHLVDGLKRGGFVLLDSQFLTAHLARFGAIEIPREQYLMKLAGALSREAVWPFF